MFNFLKKKEGQFLCPVNGKLKKLSDVNDEAFASKSMGDGFAIEPKVGEVYSPIAGKVAMIFPTLHAFAIVDSKGRELLIHIGVETVELNGEGFESLVKEGQNVKAGELISRFDLEAIKAKVPSTDIMFIFTSGEKCIINKAGYDVEVKEENIITIE